MKKNLIALACIAGIASIVSCQKEMLNDGESYIQKGQVITLNVNDNAVCKSAFDGDSTVALTGNEHFNVVYVSNDTKKTVGNVEATPSGTGSYTFTVPEELVVSDYSWYAISPYSPGVQTINTSSVNLHAKVKISPVQLPGANTFDENYDILLSNKFDVSGGSATIDQFKRLSAPLCLSVSGLDAADKIFAVTLTLNEDPAEDTGLVGQLNVKFSETFSDAGTKSITYRGNGVSAIYADGLEAIDNVWPVWFMVNPSALEKDATMTVSVTTATKTYTRTVTLPSAASLGTGNISKIKFNVKGDGYSEKNTIFQAFTPKSVTETIRGSATPSLTASNGNSYSWNFSRTGCGMQDKEVAYGMPYGIQLSAQSGTNKFLYLPTFNKIITAAHFYMHPANYTGNKASFYKTDASEEAFASNVAFSNTTLSNEGGVCSVTLPDTLETLGETVLRVNGTTNVAAALFEVTDQPYDSNDYFDMYDKGIDFTIGDKVINKTTCPTYKLTEAGSLTLDDITSSKVDILFIDNSAEVSVSSSATISLPNGKVFVGRFKDGNQPVLKETSTGYLTFRPNNSYIKNIRMESSGAAHFASADADGCSFVCEDCTIICAGTLLREGNVDTKFGDVVFNNCVIENAGSGLLSCASGAKPVLGLENSIAFNNCVVSTKSSDGTSMTNVAANILDFTSSTSTDEATVKITLTGNTFVGFGGTSSGAALVYAKQIGSFDIQKNIFVGSWKSGKTNRLIKTTTDQSTNPDPRNISYNYGMSNGTVAISETNGDSQKHWNSADHTKALSYTHTDNLFLATSPFVSTDYTNLYFPVNTEVVTNGAGASYDTKLWKNWTGGETKATSEGFHTVD